MTDNDPGELFEELERMKLDPYIQRSIGQAREIEEILKSIEFENGQVTCMLAEQQASDLLEMMNAECPYVNQTVQVSGRLVRAVEIKGENDATGVPVNRRFGTEEVIVSDKPLVSIGYGILKRYLDDEGSSVLEVGNMFVVEVMPTCNDCAPLVDYAPRRLAFAPIGTTEIQYTRNPPENQAFLRESVPEIMRDIDERIDTASDTCDAILALADIKIQPNQDVQSDAIDGLAEYVRGRLHLDTLLPYELQMSGGMYGNTDTQPKYVYLQEGAEMQDFIAYIHKPSLHQYPEIKDNMFRLTPDKYWCIDIAVLSRDPTQDIRHMTVPVCNIHRIRSVRDMLYGA